MENNYQLSLIHNYVNGLMSKEDMYAFERAALEDPFLQDAIDGYKLQQGVDIKQLSLLQQRLLQRVENQATHRNKRFYNWQRLAIGMAAGVLFISVCTLLLLRYFPKQGNQSFSEIVIKDAVYDYKIIPSTENSALPVGGWEKLYDVLNTSYSNHQNYVGIVNISFQVDKDRKASRIVIAGDNKYKDDEELLDIIRNKVKWEGEKGSFRLDFTKIQL